MVPRFREVPRLKLNLVQTRDHRAPYSPEVQGSSGSPDSTTGVAGTTGVCRRTRPAYSFKH